jgi:hypothetical protein
VGTSDAKVHVLDHEASLLRATELARGPVRGPSLPFPSLAFLSSLVCPTFFLGSPRYSLSTRAAAPRALAGPPQPGAFLIARASRESQYEPAGRWRY